MSSNPNAESFWEHLDELRGCIIKILIAVGIFMVVMFCMKDLLFSIALAPANSDFITYRLIGAPAFSLHLMNTGLTEQFIIHVKTAAYAGMMLASPVILYQLFRFISPALYTNERRYATIVVGSAFVMFFVGTLLNYFVVFPLTVRFLGTYQVSDAVENMLTIQSYMDTLLSMNLMLGVMFELPVVCWLLGMLGVLQASMMTKFRRHAIVAVIVAAAIITPTTDAFTLFVVALPIWLLYELSILLVKITNLHKH